MLLTKPIKWLLALILTPIALLIIAVVVASFFVNAAAKKGIESGASYALGVPTTLNSASVGILSGKLGLSGLRIANPPGFKADKFLSLGDGRVAVSLASLTKDTITVPEFTLDTIDVNLERTASSANYKVIMDNLAKLGGKGGEPKPAPGGEKEKRLIINELTIRNVNVRADLLAGGGGLGAAIGQAAGPITVPIAEIKLKNVGKTGTGVGGTGVTVKELSSIIVQAVLAAAAENGGGLLPADLLGDLKGGLAKLDGLENVGMEIGGKLRDVGKQLGQQAEEIGKDLEGKAKDAGKQLEKLGEGLKDILPKKPK
jgi:hypothetical protein